MELGAGKDDLAREENYSIELFRWVRMDLTKKIREVWDEK